MIEKIIATGVLMLGSTAMIFARRYKNSGSSAGAGIAGWTIFGVILIWSQP